MSTLAPVHALFEQQIDEMQSIVSALLFELDGESEHLGRVVEKLRLVSSLARELDGKLRASVELAREVQGGQSAQFQALRASIEHLAAISAEVVDAARVDAIEPAVRAEPLEITALLSALSVMFEPFIQNDALHLIFEPSTPGAVMMTDKGKLAEILRSLITNALRFTSRGEVRVRATVTDDRILFAVSDAGELIPRAAPLGSQAEAAIESWLSRHMPGVGAGLPHARRLAERLGGTLTIRSQPRVGTTFFVELPRILTSRDASPITPPLQPKRDQAREAVLFVEDDEATLALYEAYLRRSPFQFFGARSLPEAQKVLQQLRPSVVVLDILLETEASWALLQQLKRDPRTASIPVLVVSLVAGEFVARGLGADGFCSKPVERGQLLSKLRAVRGSGGFPGKVLVIDPDDASRTQVARQLSDLGYDVVEALGGDTAVAQMAAERPRIILMDIALDAETRSKIVADLRADPARRATPLVITSSRPLDAGEAREIEAARAVPFIKHTTSYEVALGDLHHALGAARKAAG